VRRGFKFTYHFRIVWERLYQVIEKFQREQNVPTEKFETPQNAVSQKAQNVSTEPPQWQQNVPKEQWQNVATPDTHRENNTENKEIEITDRENETVWQQIREKVQEGLPIGESAAQLSGTTLLDVTDTSALIFVANRFAIPWLERRLYGQIAKALKAVIGKDVDLQFILSDVGFSPAGSFGE
jgi:hypothetical protein